MIGLFLEQIAEHLHSENTWTVRQCKVQFEAVPPARAPEWFVGIDDGGMAQTAPEDSNYVREVARIQIGIWRRQGEVPRDDSGIPLKHTDPYRSDRQTLETIERKVIRALIGLPQRNDLVEAINAVIQADQDEYGECVGKPLRYLGRGKNETYIPRGHQANEDIPTFIGRRLNFVGLDRIQELSTNLR